MTLYFVIPGDRHSSADLTNDLSTAVTTIVTPHLSISGDWSGSLSYESPPRPVASSSFCRHVVSLRWRLRHTPSQSRELYLAASLSRILHHESAPSSLFFWSPVLAALTIFHTPVAMIFLSWFPLPFIFTKSMNTTKSCTIIGTSSRIDVFMELFQTRAPMDIPSLLRASCASSHCHDPFVSVHLHRSPFVKRVPYHALRVGHNWTGQCVMNGHSSLYSGSWSSQLLNQYYRYSKCITQKKEQKDNYCNVLYAKNHCKLRTHR